MKTVEQIQEEIDFIVENARRQKRWDLTKREQKEVDFKKQVILFLKNDFATDEQKERLLRKWYARLDREIDFLRKRYDEWASNNRQLVYKSTSPGRVFSNLMGIPDKMRYMRNIEYILNFKPTF